MGILGITNRTENFKTAKTFAPFLVDDSMSAERRLRLAKKLGEPGDTAAKDVTLELFWKGMRDALPQGERSYSENRAYELAKRYQEHFSGLRDKIEQFEGPPRFEPLKAHNYRADDIDQKKSLYNSLLNAEIDIVLETPNHLYIGEAKDESGFHASSKLVLVHQLIRQYVLAKTLPSHISKKQVVPFIVRPRKDHGGDEKAQVEFMKKHYRLTDANILTWDDIDRIAKG